MSLVAQLGPTVVSGRATPTEAQWQWLIFEKVNTTNPTSISIEIPSPGWWEITAQAPEGAGMMLSLRDTSKGTIDTRSGNTLSLRVYFRPGGAILSQATVGESQIGKEYWITARKL